MKFVAIAMLALAAWPTSARASAVTDRQIAQLFLAGAQLQMIVERGLRQYPPMRQAFERLGATKGCEAWNAAFAANDARLSKWTAMMIAAARATVPDDVLAAASRAGVTEGDEVLRPYKPEMLRAMMAAGAGAVAQASANDVVTRMAAAAEAVDVTGVDPAARSAEVDALMAANAGLCTTAP